MTLNIAFEGYIESIEEKLPELATSSDLVRLGLFSSESAVCRARKLGNSPDYIQISPGKILYPRKAVVTFYIQRVRKGSNQASLLTTLSKEDKNG